MNMSNTRGSDRGRDADAAIAHRHDGAVVLVRCGDPDAAAFVGVLGGVVEEIGEDLREAHRIRFQE